MSSFAYDLEIVPNCFTATFINVDSSKDLIDTYKEADINKNVALKKDLLNQMDTRIFIIFEDINELRKLYNFIIDNNTQILIGYNNFSYDDIVVDYIIQNIAILSTKNTFEVNTILYNLSKDIIAYQQIGSYRKDYNIEISNKYTSIDEMKLNALDKIKVSLKQVSIALKWYRVEDYTPPPITYEEAIKYYGGIKEGIAWYDRYVLPEHLPAILDYNANDVLILIVLYHHTIDELKNRIATQIKYGVNVLSLSRSGVADRLMSKGYEDATGLNWWDFKDKRTYRRSIKFNDIILPTIKFKTNELQEFLLSLKKKVIKVGHDNFKETIIFNGTGYTFAKGGLHSVDRGAEFKASDDILLIDWDFDSYYPGFVIEYKTIPKHLSPSIIDVIRHHRDTRVKAKKEGDKVTADIGKIVLNSGVFGKLGFEYSFMYDILQMYKVTVNLQLILLMLIEKLELLGIHIISANTDGIVSKVPKHLLEIYKQTCIDFAKGFRFSGEFTYYKKYIRTSVNHYIAIKTDDKVKLKGEFVYDIQINKGYNMPIVAKVLYEYYVNDNKDIDTLIRQYDIYDYCISVKVGRQFRSELHSIKNGKKHVEVLQKDNRYFVSNSGGVFLKHNIEKNSYTNVVKKHYVTIFNTYYKSDDYNINYNFYKAQVLKVINRINNEITSKAKKQTGNLFDNLE